MITRELTSQIFDSMSMGILTLDRDMKVRYWNKWLELNSGLSSDTINGKAVTEFFPEIDSPQFRRNVKSVFKLGNYCHFSQKLHSYLLKFKVLDTMGLSFEYMQQNCTMGPLKGSDGKIELVFLTVQDMTDNVRMEIILNEQATFVKNDPAPVLRVNRDGEIINANHATDVLLGKNSVGMRMSEIFPAYEDLLATMKKNMESNQFESYINGKTFLFSIREDEITDSYYVYGSNISDLKSAEESLRKANESLDIRVKEKTRELMKELDERKRVEETLKTSEERFRVSLKDSKITVFTQNSDLKYTWVYNPVSGLSPDFVIGKTDNDLIPGEDAKVLTEMKRRVLETGVEEQGIVRFTIEGVPSFYDISIEPMRDKNERIVGIIGVSTDITGIKQAEEEILKLNEELEQRVKSRTIQLEVANQELEAFANTVSHELRAPLRSIDGFSHAIVKQYSDIIDDEAQDLFSRIRAASQRMAALIDGLLELPRLSRTELIRVEVDLSRLARKAVEYLRNTNPERNVSLEIMDGLVARGDRKLLQIVIQNLLNNAWKFTSENESSKIKFGSEEQDGRLVFYIRDNGAGFNMEYLDKLFKPFQRLHSMSEFSGTGIGLASVKRIIARHGGDIWAEAHVGEGATFYFTL